MGSVVEFALVVICVSQNCAELNAIYGFINGGYDSRMCHRYLLNQPIYHGLLGSVSTLECSKIKFGPPVVCGDTVGCGIDFSTQKVFFTYNGQYLGAAYSVVSVLCLIGGGGLLNFYCGVEWCLLSNYWF